MAASTRVASTKAVSTMTEPTNDQPLESVPAGRQPKSAAANMQPATRTTLHNQQPAIAQSRATKRLAPDALGMKALITATSLAVTLGGWAVLTIERPKTPAVVESPAVDTSAVQPSAPTFELSLAPMPTIVAPPPPPPEIVIDTPPPAPVARPAARRSSGQIVARPAAVPQPAAESQPAPGSEPAVAPQPAVEPAPAVQQPLRVVSAPPKPKPAPV